MPSVVDQFQEAPGVLGGLEQAGHDLRLNRNDASSAGLKVGGVLLQVGSAGPGHSEWLHGAVGYLSKIA